MRFGTHIYTRINKAFSNMSLLKKLTAAYIIAILIPTITIGAYNYYQTKNYVKEEIFKNNSQTLAQTIENINYKLLITRGIGEGIAYNNRIIEFLRDDFVFNSDTVESYNYNVALLKDAAYNFSQSDVANLGIYMTNSSLTEDWNAFYSEKRISTQNWYKDFKNGKKDSTWVPVHTGELYPEESNKSRILYMTFVKKIYSFGSTKYLGVIALDIMEDKMFSSMKKTSGEFYVINDKNKLVYSSKKKTQEEMKIDPIRVKGEKGSIIRENDLYVYETVKDLGVKIVYKADSSKLLNTYKTTGGSMLVAVFMGVVLLEISTYLIVKTIFTRMKKIIDVMETVSEGNFDIRIPVTTEDELGVLAKSFNILLEKIRDLIKDILKKEVAQKNAQLKALQYQINPHFIYNTIDIFRMKLELLGIHETADALAKFGKMLRYNIGNDNKYSTIKDEVKLVGNYIGIQKFRYEDRIKLNIDLPEYLKEFNMIKFLIQPVVENCIKHGLGFEQENIHIKICFKQKNKDVIIEVCDDGKGISKVKLDALNFQFESQIYDKDMSGDDGAIGLANINKRIKLFYGSDYSIKMDSELGKYTKVIMRIAILESVGDINV